MKGETRRMFDRRAFFAVVVCAAFTLGVSNSGLCFGRKELETESVSVKFLREVERGAYQVVTTDELMAWIDKKKDMVIVDTMPYEASYKKNHVPGAVQFLFPKAGDMTEWNTSETAGKTQDDYMRLLGPDKNKTIVLYCGFVKCDRSHNGAMWATKLGYKNVYRYPGGIKAWKEAKYPVEKVK
jgi:rhodanese-related sulfurtransferase